MGFIYAIISAIFWGIKPSLVTKIKAKTIHTQLGMSLGVLIVGTIVFLATLQTSLNDLSGPNGWKIIIFSALSGMVWAIGQYFQYISYFLLSTSLAFGVGTAFTLVFNALFSVIVFHDWQTSYQLSMGFSGIFVIVIGTFLVSYRQNRKEENKKDLIVGFIMSILAALFFMLYSNLPRFATYNTNISSFSTIFPHAIGTFIGSIIVVLIIYFGQELKHHQHPDFHLTPLFDKKLFYSIFPGFLSSGANFFLLLANPIIGSAVGYTLSQMAVVISTILSLFVLKEYKLHTKRENVLMITGVVVILCGAILIGFSKA